MYLDNAATTPLTQGVKEYIISLLDTYQNPSSIYQDGVNTKRIIEQSRNNVAKFINAEPENIIFTSGGSASNTLAIKGYIARNGCIVLYQPTCHKSILKCVEHIKKAYPLKVNSQGLIDMNDLRDWFDSHDKFFIVLEYANSEIGTIQNIKEIINMCHFYNAIVYVDCTGSVSQIPINVKDIDYDMLGFSGHKIHALKGIGVLYKKKNIELEPLIYGSQEQGLFAGTSNTLGIASLGKTVECYDYSFITSDSRDYVYEYIRNNISDCYLIGTLNNRLPHNLYMCIKGIQGESLMILLDVNGYQVSTGSACTSNDLKPSSTLMAINVNKDDINSCIRITFNGQETQEELDKFCNVLKQNVEMLRRLK